MIRNRHFFLVWLLVLGACRICTGQELHCDLCGQVLHSKYFILEDRAEGGKKNFCRDCSDLDERCFACGLPVKRSMKRLADGRWLCDRDAAAAVDEVAAKSICEGVRNDLDRLFSRFMTMPSDDVSLSMVDRIHLESLFKSPGYEHSCVSIFGATQTQPLPGKRYIHSVSILSDLRRSRLMAVYAHELTHAWLGENVRADRRTTTSPDSVEGFCELVAYHYMESKHESFEMQVIHASEYTRGQIGVMLKAEEDYGFNAILEWMKSGEDSSLDIQKLDRVRAVVNSTPSAIRPAPSMVVTQTFVAPSPTPTSLKLKAISGPDRRRIAMINDGTFEVNEKGQVHVGANVVTLRCLEIRKDSVLIQIEGASSKKELVLGAN